MEPFHIARGMSRHELSNDDASVYTAGWGVATMPRTSAPKNVEGQGEMTASVQDYLAAIYDLAGSGKPVIGARVAKHMNISAPAVTEAIHRMERGGYVKIGASKSLTLTPKGREIAEVMARRHRLLE